MALSREDIICLIDDNGFRDAMLRVFLARSEELTTQYWTFEQQPQKLGEVIYCVYHNITPPTCQFGHKLRYKDSTLGYRVATCCGIDCRAINIRRSESAKDIPKELRALARAKAKVTMLEKYGVENAFLSTECRNKAKVTMLEKYGVDNVFKSQKYQKKAKVTMLERHGVEHASKMVDHREKVKETSLKNYGVEHYAHTEKAKEASRLRMPDTAAKGKITMMQRYGVDNIFKLSEYQDKVKETLLENYGVANFSQAHYSERTKDILSNEQKFREFAVGKNFEIFADVLGDVAATTVGLIARKYNCVDVFSFGRLSIYQSQMCRWLESLNIPFFQNDRSVLRPKEIDIYIPSHSLGIEVDGLYYHSVKIGKKDSTYHKDKQDRAREAQVTLLQITTDEWMHRAHFIKDMILRTVGRYEIDASKDKCVAKSVETKHSNDFIIQNNREVTLLETDLSYGLYCNDHLMLLMTFRNIGGSDYELIHHTFENGVFHNLGYKTLFDYAMKQLDFKKVISYSDRRFNYVPSLSSIGFVEVETVQPKYYYTDYYHKYKTEAFKSLISERHGPDVSIEDAMAMHCYDMIWDAGHIKWIWSRK